MLPAAVSLQKQGANKGAVTAFLIATPESGVDSMAVTYALLDPIMTVARPVAAFLTAAVAGVAENLRGYRPAPAAVRDLSCPVDNCCDGVDCPPRVHRRHHSFQRRLMVGLRYALFDLWDDMAGWFLVGLLLAGVMTALIPDELFARYLGQGLPAMLGMLALGIPMYICATASTPIAAAMILKGVSPGAALVFLLSGPATNITAITVLLGILGKRATAIYFAAVAVVSVLCGLALDLLYGGLGLSAVALAGVHHEILPDALKLAAAGLLLLLSARKLLRRGRMGRATVAGPRPAAPVQAPGIRPRMPFNQAGGCAPSCGCRPAADGLGAGPSRGPSSSAKA